VVSKPVTAEEVLAALKRAGSAKVRDGYARYGIKARQAFGIPMGTIQKLAKGYGKSHALAAALWKSGWYEARLMAAYVDEPEKVTPAQMDAWCEAFDNWGVCDTITFVLFDRTPFAFDKIHAWATRDEEFVKRGAFALLAAVALHDKGPIESKLEKTLPLCAAAATDDRNFVKKGVSWALRTIGMRDRALHGKVIALAEKLAAKSDAAARWIGKDVLRDLQRPLVAKRLAAKAAKAASAAKVASATKAKSRARTAVS
jgi:3-methyladenine DNA glycosylase AlkD